MCDCCGTWPEQNAVDAWLKKHGIEVDHKVSMELKDATTKYRIEVQDELYRQEKENADLRARLAAAEAQVGALREALRKAEWMRVYSTGTYYGHSCMYLCAGCGNKREDGHKENCSTKLALSTPPPVQWEAMRQVLEAARDSMRCDWETCPSLMMGSILCGGSILKNEQYCARERLRDALAALEGGGAGE
jgi:hypothetical protein